MRPSYGTRQPGYNQGRQPASNYNNGYNYAANNHPNRQQPKFGHNYNANAGNNYYHQSHAPGHQNRAPAPAQPKNLTNSNKNYLNYPQNNNNLRASFNSNKSGQSSNNNQSEANSGPNPLMTRFRNPQNGGATPNRNKTQQRITMTNKIGVNSPSGPNDNNMTLNPPGRDSHPGMDRMQRSSQRSRNNQNQSLNPAMDSIRLSNRSNYFDRSGDRNPGGSIRLSQRSKKSRDPNERGPNNNAMESNFTYNDSFLPAKSKSNTKQHQNRNQDRSIGRSSKKPNHHNHNGMNSSIGQSKFEFQQNGNNLGRPSTGGGGTGRGETSLISFQNQSNQMIETQIMESQISEVEEDSTIVTDRFGNEMSMAASSKNRTSVATNLNDLNLEDAIEKYKTIKAQNKQLKKLILGKQNKINTLKKQNLELKEEIGQIMDPIGGNSLLKEVKY